MRVMSSPCTGAEGFIHSEESVVMSPESVPLHFADRPAKYRLRRATLGGPLAPTTTVQKTADQASRSFASDATMAAMSTKPTFALEITGSEAENTMRKNVFAAAVGIQDATLSNLAQPLVRIALKLLQLLRTHRSAHAGPGAYNPPDDAAHDQWMANEEDLVDAAAEFEVLRIAKGKSKIGVEGM